nr:M10 family metallopeptidase C-terminal domain-containing protein [Neoroseomonas eburnea]
MDVLTLGDGGVRVLATGVERIRGGTGDDVITLSAASGRAVIEGGAGNDTLTGGSGADEIFGGAGRDYLVGGAGADLFIYTAASQSSVAAPDTIVNFNPLEGDMLAFAGIGDGNSFRWRGAFAFTGEGGVEGRFDEATKTLRIDLDGDGQADMAFLLPGFPPDGFDGHSVIWA